MYRFIFNRKKIIKSGPPKSFQVGAGTKRVLNFFFLGKTHGNVFLFYFFRQGPVHLPVHLDRARYISRYTQTGPGTKSGLKIFFQGKHTVNFFYTFFRQGSLKKCTEKKYLAKVPSTKVFYSLPKFFFFFFGRVRYKKWPKIFFQARRHGKEKKKKKT